MTGARTRQLALVVSAVAALLAAGLSLGLGTTGGTEQVPARSTAAVSASAVLGPATGGAPDSRLQREPEGKSRSSSRHDAASGPSEPRQQAQAWAAALAALLERAGHPERLGHLLLRGPPGSSA